MWSTKCQKRITYLGFDLIERLGGKGLTWTADHMTFTLAPFHDKLSFLTESTDFCLAAEVTKS